MRYRWKVVKYLFGFIKIDEVEFIRKRDVNSWINTDKFVGLKIINKLSKYKIKHI